MRERERESERERVGDTVNEPSRTSCSQRIIMIGSHLDNTFRFDTMQQNMPDILANTISYMPCGRLLSVFPRRGEE